MGRLRITRECTHCQKPFHPWGGNHPGLFCSYKCRGQAEFWSHVPVSANGCWEWSGRRDKDGYGRFSHIQRAHRYSWILHFGPIVPSTLHVLHHCDNPPCVRPDHLFLGTTVDNTLDKVKKGRQNRGETHGMAIVSADQVREIRERYAQGGISQIALGAEYGLKQTSVSGIVLRKYWPHIE